MSNFGDLCGKKRCWFIKKMVLTAQVQNSLPIIISFMVFLWHVHQETLCIRVWLCPFFNWCLPWPTMCCYIPLYFLIKASTHQRIVFLLIQHLHAYKRTGHTQHLFPVLSPFHYSSNICTHTKELATQHFSLSIFTISLLIVQHLRVYKRTGHTHFSQQIFVYLTNLAKVCLESVILFIIPWGGVNQRMQHPSWMKADWILIIILTLWIFISGKSNDLKYELKWKKKYKSRLNRSLP